MKWEPGRQGSGYEKCLLATRTWPLPWDLYLLRYKAGSFIGVHRDPVEGRRHYRLNIVLLRARGGDFWCTEDGLIFSWWRFTLFRPDRAYHSVSQIMKGTRYVLSFGFTRALSGSVRSPSSGPGSRGPGSSGGPGSPEP